MSITGWKMFPWAPDGTYDNSSTWTRHVVVNGMPTYTITKAWLDNNGPDDVTAALRQPWGSFPDLPPKPDKK
jgi:hypothetical protein